MTFQKYNAETAPAEAAVEYQPAAGSLVSSRFAESPARPRRRRVAGQFA